MKLKQLLFCGLLAAFTAIGSLLKIPIPGTPLIITLQTFFVFMSGLLLEPKYAFLSQLAYTAIGLLGLPVFSEGGGIAYVLRPSFGFIVGFCVCAPIISLIVRKNLLASISLQSGKLKPIVKASVGALASVAAMYAVGSLYMFMIFNLYIGQSKSLWTVVSSATGIFIVVDIIKFAFAIPLCIAIQKRISRLLV
jgi:biotin transport system substrate-specific component